MGPLAKTQTRIVPLPLPPGIQRAGESGCRVVPDGGERGQEEQLAPGGGLALLERVQPGKQGPGNPFRKHGIYS